MPELPIGQKFDRDHDMTRSIRTLVTETGAYEERRENGAKSSKDLQINAVPSRAAETSFQYAVARLAQLLRTTFSFTSLDPPDQAGTWIRVEDQCF